MLKSFSVLNSDHINKYGHMIILSALEDMIWMHSTDGGVPMHFGHDMHRPVGRMIPYGLYFIPGMVRTIGITLIPENDDESKGILEYKNYFNSKTISESLDKTKDLFLPLIKDAIVDKVYFLKCNTIAVENTDIVKRLFPELLSVLDRDGLIYIKDLKNHFTYKSQGVFIHNSRPLCIYAHNYFRRSLSRHNSLHYIFLDEMMKHDSNENVTIRLAIDWDLIGYAPDFLQTMEYEYWFGPKFNDDISKIAAGVTKHQASEFERKYYGISATEFVWKDNDELKEFEMEELRENEAPTIDDFYGCRYIHSIYDSTKSTFAHFDGAIRGYDTELYLERIGVKMTDFGRRSNYKKIFRIDGQLALQDWKSLILNYMQGNPLVYEYFDIAKPESPLEKNEPVKSLMETLVPCKLDKKDGLRMFVSYHCKNENFNNHTHAISRYDIVETAEGSHIALEYEIIEVKKALNRLGKSLYIDESTYFGTIKDKYWNIPCIFHSAENPAEDIAKTLESLRNIFMKLVERKSELIISFTISWNCEDKEVLISVAGNVEDLLSWLENNTYPTTREELKQWIEIQREYLNSKYGSVSDLPDLAKLCQFDGVLYFKRKVVGPEFELKPYEDEAGLNCTIKLPDNDLKYKPIIDQEIIPTAAFIIEKSKCSKSGLPYIESQYSKFLDDDVRMIVEKISGLVFYWTDKHIYN